ARTVVHGRRDVASAKEGFAGAHARIAAGLPRQPRERGFLLDGDRLYAEPAQNGLLIAARIGVQLLVEAMEALDRVGEQARRDLAAAAGNGHRHIERLAGIAERRHPLVSHAPLAARDAAM